MGNEAIAYGAFAAGVTVAAGYPGTPSSEVLDTMLRLVGEGKVSIPYVEWAVNEKVALEIALGAALTGARALVTMKGPGINIAADPLLSAAYSGVKAGMTVLVADDPGPHTTQTEQDSRWYGDLAKLPVIEPSDPQEAHDYVALGMELSEKLELPVIFRTTTRVNHAVGDVRVGKPVKLEYTPSFVKNPKRYLRAVMPWNRERHGEVLEALKRAEEVADDLNLNKVEGKGDLGIICAGAAYGYVTEILDKRGVRDRFKVLKLGLIHPLPRKIVSRLLESVEKVYVVEEIDPYLEVKVKALSHELDINVEVVGKESGDLPKVGELTPDAVEAMLFRKTGEEVSAPQLPRRPPPFCPGCPHMGTFMGLRTGIRKAGYRLDQVPVIGDIGCYALALNPPFEMIWTEHSMGASISMAMGIKAAGYPEPVIATIGDSTFYHAGLPALVEAVHKNLDLLIMILDNSTVAMTGHQITPGDSLSPSGRKLNPLNLMEVVKGMGIKHVALIDPYNYKEVEKTVSEYLNIPGVKVIIAKRACAILTKRAGVEEIYQVDLEKCTGCMACTRLTGCPALMPVEGKVKIMEEDCVGCSLCAQVCPYNAIFPKRVERR